MAITSAGIGSNLDIEGIISQLMTLEKAPLTALSRKQSVFQGKISALGSLKGALSALQTAASSLVPATGSSALQKFSTFKTSITDTAIASATASSNAVVGNYSLEVTQLAKQHRIVSSATATPFTGVGGTLVTGGTLTIRLDTKPVSGSPSKTTNVIIADGATPDAIRDAINNASAGVSATVINGTLGKQLVLVSDTPGTNQFIKLSGVTALAYDPSAAPAPLTDAFSQTQSAQGSAFTLNGIAVTADTNTVTTAIDGLTLNLTAQSAAGVATTLTVTRDTSNLTVGVLAFMKAYNDFNTTAHSLGDYNVTTKEAGTLNGDNTLRSAHSMLRSLIGSIPSELSGATLQRLSDIGLSLQKDGALSLDSAKLEQAISSNLPGIANLLAAYGSGIKTATDRLIGATGTIAARTEGINASIKSITKQSEVISDRLTQIEARYRKQFTALDTLMSSLTKTSNYLTSALANLPKSSTN